MNLLFGRPKTGARNDPLYGDFLPPNTEGNDPAGKGFVRYSVELRQDLPLDRVVGQGADVVFNPHAIGGGDVTPTNVFETTIVPNQNLIRGQVFAAQDKPGIPGGKKLTLKTRDAEFSTMPDPRATGVTLYVRSNFADGNSVDKYSLPASGWSVRGTKYMYKDSRLVNGPIKAAKIDLLTGSVTINGKGAKLTHSLAVMPDSMDVVLLTGGNEYCASFGGIKRITPLKKFLATVAPPPDACPALKLAS